MDSLQVTQRRFQAALFLTCVHKVTRGAVLQLMLPRGPARTHAESQYRYQPASSTAPSVHTVAATNRSNEPKGACSHDDQLLAASQGTHPVVALRSAICSDSRTENAHPHASTPSAAPPRPPSPPPPSVTGAACIAAIRTHASSWLSPFFQQRNQRERLWVSVLCSHVVCPGSGSF
jgi:hypothetical protein